MGSKLKLELHKIIHEYMEWANQVYDYNYPTPKLVEAKLGQLYEVRGDPRLIKRVQEPTFQGFADWLATTPLPTPEKPLIKKEKK